MGQQRRPDGLWLFHGEMTRIHRHQLRPELSQAAADDPSPERIRARLEWLMADPATVTVTVTEELVDIRRTVYARPGFADSARHILCLQDAEVRRRNLITDQELAAIASPTLVVWTSDDPSGPAAVQQARPLLSERIRLRGSG